METKILSIIDFKTSLWTGGSTTQLFIYPENASLHQRDFLFRLSSAVVEAETSVFTSMLGISRKLMVLEGEMELVHQGHHRKQLKSMEIDMFEGDWFTKSFGKCTDFNFMYQNIKENLIKPLIINQGDKLDITLDLPHSDFVFLYLFSGRCSIICLGKRVLIQAGEMLMLKNPDFRLTLSLWAEFYSKAVFVQVVI